MTEEAEKVNEDLLSLPEPPATNLLNQLCVKLMSFQWAIEQAIDGANGHNKLNEEWHNAADRFAETIASSFPKLKPSKGAASTPKQVQAELVSQQLAPYAPGVLPSAGKVSLQNPSPTSGSRSSSTPLTHAIAKRSA